MKKTNAKSFRYFLTESIEGGEAVSCYLVNSDSPFRNQAELRYTDMLLLWKLLAALGALLRFYPGQNHVELHRITISWRQLPQATQRREGGICRGIYDPLSAAGTRIGTIYANIPAVCQDSPICLVIIIYCCGITAEGLAL